MDNIEKLLLIVLFITMMYYLLCAIVGFIELYKAESEVRKWDMSHFIMTYYEIMF